MASCVNALGVLVTLWGEQDLGQAARDTAHARWSAGQLSLSLAWWLEEHPQSLMELIRLHVGRNGGCHYLFAIQINAPIAH